MHTQQTNAPHKTAAKIPKEDKNMKNATFGIEIEFTGISRNKAARITAELLNGTIYNSGSTFEVTAPDGRVWKLVYDSSVSSLKKVNGEMVFAGDAYKVELVSPKLTY